MLIKILSAYGRPRNCILAGASGTHTVCVCVHHENVNPMLDAVDLKEPTCEKFSPLRLIMMLWTGVHGEIFYIYIFQFREKRTTLRVFVSKNTKLYNNDMKLQYKL